MLFSAIAAAALPELDQPHRTGASNLADAAVVVGIEDYFVLPDVPYAVRDAQVFYDFALYTRGIPSDRVTLLTGPVSLEQLTAALQAAGGSTRAGGTVFVYFAGHGAASPSTGERVLLAADAQPDLATFQARSVALPDVRRWVTASGASAVLVLDTCYSGRSRSGEDVLPGKRFAIPASALAPSPNVVEWTAAGPDQWSGPLDAARHGAFTYLAVGALRGWADGQLDGARDGRVTAEEASRYVEAGLRSLQLRDQRPERVGPAAMVLSTGREQAPALAAPAQPALAQPAPAQPAPAQPAPAQPAPAAPGPAAERGRPVLGAVATAADVQVHLSALDALVYPDDKLDKIRWVAQQQRFTCAQVGAFVDALDHPSHQVAAIRALRGAITDPEHHAVLVNRMSFADDRREVEAVFAE